jgi:electron transport complex protein RnfC
MRPLSPQTASIEALQSRIVDAGIIGMGGAGFPSHVKLREGIAAQHDGTVDLLIINGVECEPMISSDDCLMRERTIDVVEGTRVLMRALAARRCIIAIEADMEQALVAMREATDATIQVVSVPEIYPAGGEKQLIRMLTGAEVPSHGLPIDVGVVMHNVATAVAVGDAVLRGMPLLERVVTVCGAIDRPANLRVHLGTPVQHLLDFCGGIASNAYVVSGGPMMGTRVVDTCAPITKTTNALVVMLESEDSLAMPCIRCGDCVDVCPVQLQPQALYEFARSEEWDSAQDYHLFDCIECGACAYVCPSRIALVPQYRQAKASIARLDAQRQQASELRRRFQAHQWRVTAMSDEAIVVDENEDEDRIGLSTRTAVDRSVMQAEIAAAIARVKAKRSANQVSKPAENNESNSANADQPFPDGDRQ